jgi:hypothetical protein
MLLNNNAIMLVLPVNPIVNTILSCSFSSQRTGLLLICYGAEEENSLVSFSSDPIDKFNLVISH